MRRLRVALMMLRIPSERRTALRYLVGKWPLAAWEEELILKWRHR